MSEESKKPLTAQEILKGKMNELNQDNGSFPSYKYMDKELRSYFLEAMEEYSSILKQALEQKDQRIKELEGLSFQLYTSLRVMDSGISPGTKGALKAYEQDQKKNPTTNTQG